MAKRIANHSVGRYRLAVRTCLTGMLFALVLANSVHAQITPDLENQRRARQAEIERKKAEEQRQEAVRRQKQAQAEAAEAQLEQVQSERERAEAQARVKRLEEEIAKLKAAQAASAPAPPSPPLASYPDVDGLPLERLQSLQRETAAGLGMSPGQMEFADRLANGQWGPRMVVLPNGRFSMGSDQGDDDEKPVHTRRMQAFALMKTEVTVGQYLACVAEGACREPQWREAGGEYHHRTGTDSSYRKFGSALTDESSPVVGVSWENARQYAVWLSGQTKQAYRLPSEAQWEYAARAGSKGRWSFGDDEAKLVDHAWFSANSEGRIQAVGGKKPNAWGLHDVHGNVWEWVQDCWHGSYQGAPETEVAWEAGCANTYRGVRGGAWFLGPRILRSADRVWLTYGDRFNYLGFRLARAL